MTSRLIRTPIGRLIFTSSSHWLEQSLSMIDVCNHILERVGMGFPKGPFTICYCTSLDLSMLKRHRNRTNSFWRHNIGSVGRIKVASNLHKWNELRPRLNILNISALYWSAQIGLATRCCAMADDFRYSGRWLLDISTCSHWLCSDPHNLSSNRQGDVLFDPISQSLRLNQSASTLLRPA